MLNARWETDASRIHAVNQSLCSVPCSDISALGRSHDSQCYLFRLRETAYPSSIDQTFS